jgi:hypothetical protein
MMMHLSDVFKYTQGLGQKGHQIGRKVGDAIELLTLGMINLEGNLLNHLVIEDGVEGATTAKHKVEFSFYKLDNDLPSKKSEDLFGLVECKKVGVEQTVKQNFKEWREKRENKQDFNATKGYFFTISPSDTHFKWQLSVEPISVNGSNLKISSIKKQEEIEDEKVAIDFKCASNEQILIALDIENNLYILGSNQSLSSIEKSLKKCVIIQIEQVKDGQVARIHVNESLPGPQTPEKAKQASFVSLDVRKKVLGQFDKSDDKSFISVLVIGEASHWEEKSRSMVRLCNDYNLIIPDEILVFLFTRFDAVFKENSQEKITKTNFRIMPEVKNLIVEIIEHFDRKVLYDMQTGKFVQFKLQNVDNSERLTIEELP